jgi:hypothetical protein
MNDVSTRNGNRSRLAIGIFLIVLGAVLLAANLGYNLPWHWWRLYPFVFMIFGVLGLVYPNRHLDRSGGVWLLATGLYCAEGVFDVFGLGWTGSWPVFVIAAGLGFMFRRSRAVGQDEPPLERRG